MTKNLISLGSLCEDGCRVILDKDNIKVYKNEVEILQGYREKSSNLYYFPFNNPEERPTTNQEMNNIQVSTKENLANFYHQCLFSPTKSTLLKALKHNLLPTWPGLTKELIQKHLIKSEATVLGHMRQTRKNLQSTKKQRHLQKHLEIKPDEIISTPSSNVLYEEEFLKNKK